mgnify:FL=1
MLETLKTKFGYTSFRPLQKEIIECLLQRKDCIVLMPTGGGKSICYQLPALLMKGVAVVVSPLISLMKDQVESLEANGIHAGALNSSNTETENELIKKQCRQGKISLLYISPEKLLAELHYFLKDIDISLFAIDEAHCISQWGHDFRPEYTQLGVLHHYFSRIPIIALTATADKITRQDIAKQLNLDKPKLFVSSFDRPNLSLKVLTGFQQKEKHKYILNFIEERPSEAGIIYCLSRKNTERICRYLQKEGIKATIYHAGLSNAAREEAQDDFIKDQVQVVCATVAFGMGIDKSNVRWVIHYNMPKSIESYYQEIGRAGRDGVASDTVLFYNVGDIILLTKFANESQQREINLEKLDRIQQYAESSICRRRILLNYFGEESSHDCGNCDVCKNPPQKFDGTVLVQMALSAIARTNEAVTSRVLVNILRGTLTPEITNHRFNEIKTFGVGRDIPTQNWNSYLLQMLQLGLFEIAYNEYNRLKITEAGKRVLFGQDKAQLITLIDKEEVKVKPKTRKVSQVRELSETDTKLFDQLRVLRKELAKKQEVPAYIIFSDKVLHLLASSKPTTLAQFGNISGIGEYKKEQYGELFIKVIQDFMS